MLKKRNGSRTENESKEKDAVFWKILLTAIDLDVHRGHLKWTITLLSKKSGISRTLIYYYFGKSKFNILIEAVGLVGQEFSGITPERLLLWKEGRFAETVKINRSLLNKNPMLVAFYFLNRDSDHEIGKKIREKEALFRRKIADFFPGLDEAGCEGVYALFFGINLVKDISDEGISRALKLHLAISPSY